MASLATIMGSPTPFSSSSSLRSAAANTISSTSNSVMLYNGVSNRSRGWKSKRPGDFGTADGKLARQPSLKKFDGAARSCSGWDHLRRDPELCFRNGNCFVHLYEKGQSQRGAAFKVPFSNLLTAQCQPLVEKHVDRSVSEDEAYQNGRVDLYIPAPATATSRAQALQYHVATRNLFAWIFRRSLVGDRLGGAVISLINSMGEFREAGDHVQDVLEYLDEEGYLDMRNQPQHALAMLHLAEVFEIRELYIDAFAHCVGMSDSLHKFPEYSRVNVASRKLIRRARLDMDFRLSRAGTMLADLLEEELSEAHLGLSTGARAHLDRFRAYIQGFYVTKLGSFPPPAADSRCSTIFRPEVYRMLKVDFEALYEYLVDGKFTTADNTPSLAQGGLCSLQSVHEYDSRHKFTPLLHPLPLLPEPVHKAKDTTSGGRRRSSLSWFPGRARENKKLRPDQRLVAHAALLRATNLAKKPYLLENRLVLAYRQFEEDAIMIPHKGEQQQYRADKKGGVSPADARKVRWLFVYAMHQTLRSCAEIPPEVKCANKVQYHLGVSTKGLPPWVQHHSREGGGNGVSPVPSFEGPEGRVSQLYRPLRSERGRSISAVPLLSPIHSPDKEVKPKFGIEIKPDIDYSALHHQDDEQQNLTRGRMDGSSTPTPRSRSQSLTRSMSIRRSLSVFQRASLTRSSTATGQANSPSRHASMRSSKSSYHEIIVHGYGNGTNDVAVDLSTATTLTDQEPLHSHSSPNLVTAATTSRSASTSSTTSSYSSAAVSVASASTTPTTLVDPQSPTSLRLPSWKVPRPVTPPPNEDHVEEYNINLTCPLPRRQSTRQRGSLRAMYSHDDMLSAAPVAEPPPLPRRSSKRFPRTPAGGSPNNTINDVSGVSSNNKRWSLADVVASLREDIEAEEDEASGSASEASYAALQPSPLRIRKKISMTHAAVVTVASVPATPSGGEDDMFRSSNDWERAVHFDVSPPHGWEQFQDLGGLQPIHLLR